MQDNSILTFICWIINMQFFILTNGFWRYFIKDYNIEYLVSAFNWIIYLKLNLNKEKNKN